MINRAIALVSTLRKSAELGALFFYFVYWTGCNLYWSLCAGSLFMGRATGDNMFSAPFVMAGMLMGFAWPIAALAMLGSHYIAATLAVVSVRPLPLLLFATAYLEMKEILPSGHLNLRSVGSALEGKLDWTYVILYSLLPILGGAFVLASHWRPLVSRRGEA